MNFKILLSDNKKASLKNIEYDSIYLITLGHAISFYEQKPIV